MTTNVTWTKSVNQGVLDFNDLVIGEFFSYIDGDLLLRLKIGIDKYMVFPYFNTGPATKAMPIRLNDGRKVYRVAVTNVTASPITVG